MLSEFNLCILLVVIHGCLCLFLFFQQRGILEEDGKRYLTQREVVYIFGEIVNEVQLELKKEGREDEFLGARVRIYILRHTFRSHTDVEEAHILLSQDSST